MAEVAGGTRAPRCAEARLLWVRLMPALTPPELVGLLRVLPWWSENHDEIERVTSTKALNIAATQVELIENALAPR